MKIEVTPQIGDELPLLLFQAHLVGAEMKADNSTPCTVCRKANELSAGKHVKRIHFHGSDFGACKRKVFNVMVKGGRGTSQDSTFLNDGHLHEASMLNNLMAGLPDGWKIEPMENKSEQKIEVMGCTIIGHTDALLYNEDAVYLIECKSVKDYTFKKVKSGEISNEWYGQIQTYLLMLGLDRAYLIVKHRETSKIIPPIRIDKDLKFIAERLNALKEIYERIISSSEQPLREHKTSKDSECLFCPFGNNIGDKSCWQGREIENE